MSEIKGQLLGIILTLMVFAGVSVTVASVYAKTAAKVNDYAKNIEEGAADEAAFDLTPFQNQAYIPGNVEFPGLSY